MRILRERELPPLPPLRHRQRPAIRLDRLTPERVNDWKVRQLKAASGNPLQLKHASVTARSVLLSSKALFSAGIRKHLTLRLPSPLPFEGVELPDAGKSRYKSEIDPALILVAAKRELADGIQSQPPTAADTTTDAAEGKAKGKGKAKAKRTAKAKATAQPDPADEKEAEAPQRTPRPELFKIILLALGAGLRRDEIDKLQWKNILWSRNAIRVETTEHGSTKSAESEADIDVDPGLLEILRGYLPQPGHGSPFVIASPVAPRPESVKNHHYRCNRQFKEVVKWLRGKGLSSRNALHALRKEFGSQICHQAGIFAASVALRHSSINLTREYYLDKKQPAFLSITNLMKAPEAAPQAKPEAKPEAPAEPTPAPAPAPAVAA